MEVGTRASPPKHVLLSTAPGTQKTFCMKMSEADSKKWRAQDLSDIPKVPHSNNG